MTSASVTGFAASRKQQWASARSLIRGRALAIMRIARQLLTKSDRQPCDLPCDILEQLRLERNRARLAHDHLRIAARRVL
jgi:hypothetical protein